MGDAGKSNFNLLLIAPSMVVAYSPTNSSYPQTERTSSPCTHLQHMADAAIPNYKAKSNRHQLFLD